MTEPRYRASTGRGFPAGATPQAGGVNFSIFSLHDRGARLLLFDGDAAEPNQVIELDPVVNRTFFFWHGDISHTID